MANETRKTPPTASIEEDELSSSCSDESDDDDLVLEGALVRNPDVDSSDDDHDDVDSDEGVQDSTPGTKHAKVETKRKAKEVVTQDQSQKKAKQKSKKKKAEPEIDSIQVEFNFCDMDPVYFHGLKSLLHSSSTVYQQYSSQLSDNMIENVAVGTVVSTTEEDQKEGNAFGFASVLNISTYQESEAIQHLKKMCLRHCPEDRKKELTIVLSGATKRPAGLLLHGRMVNMPLEIVLVLHQQLVLDMDWAIKNAEGGDAERKSLDFGVFVRLAPCQQEGGSLFYKYFDDEILCGRADFHYEVEAPKAYSKEVKEMVSIMVLTKAGHRAAMEDLSKMVHG